MKTITPEEFKKLYGTEGAKAFELDKKSTVTLIREGLGEALKDRKSSYFERVRNSIINDRDMRQQNYSDIFNRTISEAGAAQTPAQGIGTLAKGAYQVAGQVAGSSANALESLFTEVKGVKPTLEAAGKGFKKVADFIVNSDYSVLKQPIDKITDTKFVQDLVTKYDEDEDFRNSVDATANIARVVLAAKGTIDTATGAAQTLRNTLNPTPSAVQVPANFQGKNDFTPDVNNPTPAKPITNPDVARVVQNHVSTAKIIAADAAESGQKLAVKDLIANTKKEILTGLTGDPANPAFKVATKAINRLDPAQFSSVDDFARAAADAINNPTGPAPIVYNEARTKALALNKAGVSTKIPNASSMVDDFGKTAPNSTPQPNLIADVGLAKNTIKSAAKKSTVLSDIVPTKSTFSGTELTKALDLTQGDVSNIRLSTGNNTGDFIIKNKLLGKTVGEISNKLDDFYSTNYKKVRDEIKKVDKKYTQADAPRYTEALTEIQKKIKDVAGLQEDNATVQALLGKKELSLEDVQTAKELLDRHFSLYTVVGDVKSGAEKTGLANIRKEMREFIEKEVKDTTGADIRDLNNKVSTSRSVRDAIEKRSTRDTTRATITAGDIAVFLSGSAAGTPLAGIAAVLGKKIYQSPTFKLKVINYLNKVSAKERADIYTALKNNEVPKGFKITQFSKTSSSQSKT